MAVQDPKRLARDIARQYGGRVHQRDKSGVWYIFDDGFVWFIGERDHFGAVTDKAQALHERYGAVETDHFHWMKNVHGGKPRLDLDNLVASTHAKERLALMQQQAKVTYQEVLHALRLPERVLWSPVHESWCWIRGRLAVAVADAGNTYVITTVLWTSQQLFEDNPRPKESA